MPYVGWQQAFDPLLAPGARNYWKRHDFAELADGAIEALRRVRGHSCPTAQCEIFVAQVGGAMDRVAADATRLPAAQRAVRR